MQQCKESAGGASPTPSVLDHAGIRQYCTTHGVFTSGNEITRGDSDLSYSTVYITRKMFDGGASMEEKKKEVLRKGGENKKAPTWESNPATSCSTAHH